MVIECKHQTVMDIEMSEWRRRYRWNWEQHRWREVRYCHMCGTPWHERRSGTDCYPCHEAELRAVSWRAQRAVKKAVAAGRLPALDGRVRCVDCGKPARVYDHREYAKPLDVQPVCSGCNVRRGPAKETASLVWKRGAKKGKYS